jgi:AraC-like DNA-binding protein
MSIAEIAAELNYGTVFYFSRQFKKTTGIPPGA